MDGRLAVGFDGAPAIALFDGDSLAPLPGPDLTGLSNGDLSKVAWSADGLRLYAGGYGQGAGSAPVLVWEAGGTGPRREPPAGLNTLMSLRPLPDGGLFAASADPWLGVFAPDGTQRWQQRPRQMDPRGQERSLGLTRDGMVVEFGFEAWGEDRVRFDVGALTLQPDPPANDRLAPPRQDGLPIADWIDSTTPSLDGAPLPLRRCERFRSLPIHPEGDRFVLGTEWALRAFDASGAPLWENPVPGTVWAVTISGDGRLLVAAYGDGTIRWHAMEDGAELLALFPYPDGKNWIAWEPDGRFAATLGARRALKWVHNRGWDEASLELRAGQIPNSFRPEVIRRVLPQMGTPLAVYAAEEAERAAAFRRLTGGVAPGAQLHVLSVGVGEYRHQPDRLRLDWADEDAADIAAALGGQTDWPYKPGHLTVLRQEEATGTAVLDALARLRERMKLAPDGCDLAVIKFSGRGVVRGEGPTREFYLLPHDADIASETRIRRSGIPGSELQRQIAAMAGYGRVLVLLDTCNSGAALGDGDLGIDGQILRAQLGGRNVTVLASSAGSEVSREDAAWQNGAFTEVVLEALGKAGDSDGNGMISVQELASYVERRLPILSNGQQVPSIETRFGGLLFSTGL